LAAFHDALTVYLQGGMRSRLMPRLLKDYLGGAGDRAAGASGPLRARAARTLTDPKGKQG
jgi:hypothetical protein